MTLKENRGSERVWPSLETASRVADLANGLFIASLVLGVFSTILIWWMANVKEAHWNNLRRESDEKIAQANKAAALANERASINEQSAIDAKRELEAEMTARLQLQEKVAPRNLGPDQQQALADAVRGYAGKSVAIQSYAQDAEAGLLAQQIASGLQVGGLEVRPNLASIMPFGGFTVGIAVSGRDQALASLIANTLAQTRLVVGFDNKPPGPSGVGDSSAPPPPDVNILVGVKPVPKISSTQTR
jgi:hypothetical protein